MKARIVFGVLVMMFVLVQAGTAGGKDGIQKYFNDTSCKVKATTDPAQKREILNKSLQTMSKALDRVESSGLISKLSDAIALLDRGNVNGAMHKLMDFVSMVHALEGKKLTSAQADYALTSAETIIELLT